MNTRAETARQESMRWHPTVELPPLWWTPGEPCYTVAELEANGYGPQSTLRKWIRERRMRAISGNGRDVRVPASEVARVFQQIDPAKNKDRNWNWDAADNGQESTK